MSHVIDDVPGKPRLTVDPRAWFKRQLRLKLNDVIRRFGLRVADYVDMSRLRSTHTFKHIIDVGVAFGTPDLYNRYPDARIELFEPSPQFYTGLETGIMTQRTCRLHKVALGSADGEATFHLSGPASSSLLGTQTKPGRTFPTMTVPVKRLDEILRIEDLIRPVVLKIDTEGYEYAVLQGAEGLLPAIDTVILELHLGKSYAYAPQQILTLLVTQGFDLIDVLDHEVQNNKVVCCDLVFERKST
jgi:FkbM family methyltransferase